jgi:flagellar hook-length control protein FliK
VAAGAQQAAAAQAKPAVDDKAKPAEPTAKEPALAAQGDTPTDASAQPATATAEAPAAAAANDAAATAVAKSDAETAAANAKAATESSAVVAKAQAVVAPQTAGEQAAGAQAKQAAAAATPDSAVAGTSNTDKPAVKASVANSSIDPTAKHASKASGKSTDQDKQDAPGDPQAGVKTAAPDPTLGPAVATSQDAPAAPDAKDAVSRAPAESVASQANNTPAIDTSARAPHTSRLSAQALAPTQAKGTSSGGVEFDSAKFLHRVTRAFAVAQERGGEVRLRLSPPELGALRLDVSLRDGVLVAHMQTETTAARAALLDNLPTLRDRLAEQGVRIERFDVDLAQQQSGGSPDQSFARPQYEESAAWRPTRPQAAVAAAPVAAAVRSTLPDVASDRLNVIV